MLASGHPAGPSKKPTCNRFSCLFVVATILSFATSAAAQTVELTEEQVVASALGEASFEDLSEAATQRELAQATRARTWSNPRIAYGREQLFDSSAEDTLVLQQVLRLSGRYGLIAKSAEILAESERLRLDARRLAHAAAIRGEFYQLLEAQERIAVYDEWLALMSDVDDELRRRVEAGESAPYERLRLQKEVADIEAAAAKARAEVDAQRAQLGRLLELPAGQQDVRASGELMPTSPPTDEELRSAVLARPEIAAADARIRAAERLDKAANGWWVPEPLLEAGYITASSGETREHGFIADVSIALPFVNQAKDQRQQALAMKLEAAGEKEFAIHHVTAEVLGLARRIRVLNEAAATYREAGVGTATKVVETAQIAYSAGELGILELIDGYRGLVEARLTILKLAAEAREHEIEMWSELATTNNEVQQ